jgi:SAM-dependent methyltransferase
MLLGAGDREAVLKWYLRSSFYNHDNFTKMLRFTLNEGFKERCFDVLDYGGGGGQFALICKSHFPLSTVYITDICDNALLDAWRPLNIQIPFSQFEQNSQHFDVIFLNDVFEHVSDPLSLLTLLAGKLKQGGRIFIDTPKQFWIYPVTKLLWGSLHDKVLRGTVSRYHLQIWSPRAFRIVVERSNLVLTKYEEKTEYTMPADFYLKTMGISNPFVKFAARLFYRNAGWLAKNKIYCVLECKEVPTHVHFTP